MGRNTFHGGTLGQRAATMLLQNAEVDEDVSFAIFGNKESKSARRVEPFDAARTM